ncbi:tRNA uridine-5-carboxymethylaminomethyl(34) synthesis GTPase MnmE [Hwanghaeella grinnelliae]|uniref:tRNA modification GTPase MnmE n=1 Tax=Hwanghaeella grinnelliae TaxID=2500179 RepID=A0A3S2WRM5_9PROT|nr:tRNA uridine-5-carboxymethylaminomethyl(34) synthesis GTPase MnmE [Hwanghaeella grinnelliae]RVU36243.1 tRNA uridine-5-carboxymethylaminomethyl(34) synthesis GTPase MnmE [Hwanghaeella grinnelliae]
MLDGSKETIYALSTPAGRGGVAVVRVSGPDAKMSLPVLGISDVPKPRVATRAALKRAADDTPIDDALVLSFPGPASFTGEDVIEFHLHGGMAIIDAVQAILGDCPGFRLAQAGEFTRRAFWNGKIDLVEAEGLVDLIEAETEAQRIQALRQLKGSLSALYNGWQKQLADQLALVELGLDFSDEGDVEEADSGLDRQMMETILQEMQTHLNDGRRGEIVRNGIKVAIVGAPNVGKSSLLNALAGRDAAIVSDVAGTTRDRVDVHLNLGGQALVLTDTAGLRDSEDVIEQEGIRRSLSAASEADIVLLMGEYGSDDGIPAIDTAGAEPIVVWNKADLSPVQTSGGSCSRPGISISARTGDGISALEEALTNLVRSLALQSEAPALTRARHREAVHSAVARMEEAMREPDAVLLAEHLRSAVAALGRIIGKVDVEDLLDRIFRDFCIGK